MSTIILAAVATFVILILVCLLVPIRLRLVWNHRRRSIIFSWLIIEGGSNLKDKTFELDLWKRRILRKEFKKTKEGVVEKRKKKGRKTKEEPKEVEKKKARFNLRFLWEEKELLLKLTKVAVRFLGDILRAIRWDTLFLEVEVSTPDPALTGILYGQLCAVKYSTEYSFPKACIEVKPSFVNQLPKGSAESAFSIRPLNLFASFSRMFLNVPKIRLVKTFILKKRR